MTLGNLLYLTEPQFLCLYNGEEIPASEGCFEKQMI